MRTRLIACALLCVAAADANALAPLDCSKGFDALYREAAARRSAKSYEASPWRIVENAAEKAVYSFTASGHYAHPSVVRRQVVQRGDGVSINRSACSYADKAQSDRLMAEFDAMDAQLRAKAGR
ncbi:MAG: hypothetical protein NW215_15065 [Hyphomicrobiales bacterium]|nr:hypothetical protein [Hyphomicrobiales bacterium]